MTTVNLVIIEIHSKSHFKVLSIILSGTNNTNSTNNTNNTNSTNNTKSQDILIVNNYLPTNYNSTSTQYSSLTKKVTFSKPKQKLLITFYRLIITRTYKLALYYTMHKLE